MIIKEEIEITPFECERTLHIYMPDKIKKNEKLPVLYMFDGHNLFQDEDSTFGKSWGMKDYFDAIDARVVVVGIECNHEGNLRLCEFSPYSFNDRTWGNVEACGKELFQWIIEELKPYIDENYPVLRDAKHTMIGGSSMGGLMAVYGGSIHSNVFSKAACLSPYYEHVLHYLQHDLKKVGDLSNSIFYISWGRHEWRSKRALAAGSEENLMIARELTKKGAKVYPHCYEHGYHSEASWEIEVPTFMEELEILIKQESDS